MTKYAPCYQCPRAVACLAQGRLRDMRPQARIQQCSHCKIYVIETWPDGYGFAKPKWFKIEHIPECLLETGYSVAYTTCSEECSTALQRDAEDRFFRMSDYCP